MPPTGCCRKTLTNWQMKRDRPRRWLNGVCRNRRRRSCQNACSDPEKYLELIGARCFTRTCKCWDISSRGEIALLASPGARAEPNFHWQLKHSGLGAEVCRPEPFP